MQAKSTRVINLSQAIMRINDTIYQPIVPAQTTKYLNQSEKDILCEIRGKLIETCRKGQVKLQTDKALDFDQETVNQRQARRLQSVYQEATRDISQRLVELEQTLLQPHSTVFTNCIYDLGNLLNKSLTLLKEIDVGEETIAAYFARDYIYKLCEQLNILYIPINQSFDPFIGGEEKNGQLEQSSGECGGKVVSWIDTCSKTNDINYPFYAGKLDDYYQQNLRNLIDDYKDIFYSQDLFKFSEQIFQMIQPGKLYLIKTGNGTTAHAMGLRVRQDGIFELFEPNFFHLFSNDQNAIKAILKYIFTNYFASYQFCHFTITQANAYQFDSEHGLFPHRVHILQASKRITSDVIYLRILKSLYRSLKTLYEKEPTRQSNIFEIYLSTVTYFAQLIDNPNTLQNLMSELLKLDPNVSFIVSQDNKNSIINALQKRLDETLDQNFVTQNKERDLALSQLQKIQERITTEINQIKESLSNNGQGKTESRLLILTQQSIKLWRLHHKLASNGIPQVYSRKHKDKNFSPLKYLDKILADTFGSEKQADPIQRQLQKIEAHFSGYDPLGKQHLDLTMLTENLILACHQIAKPEYAAKLLNLDNAIPFFVQAYMSVFNEKLKAFQKDLIILSNDLKIDANTIELQNRFNKIFLSQNDQTEILKTANPSQILACLTKFFTSTITTYEVENTLEKIRKRMSYQEEVTTLISSLQTLINYIENAKEDYVLSISSLLRKKNPEAMDLVLLQKTNARIDRYSGCIRELASFKNILLKNCKSGNNQEVFMAVVTKVKALYPEVLPIDCNLSANFSRILDKILERDKTVVLTVDEKKKVDLLSSYFQLLIKATMELNNYVAELEHKIKLNSKPENELQELRSILLEYRRQFHHYLGKERNPDAIIRFVNESLIEFVDENRFDLREFISKKIGPKTKIGDKAPRFFSVCHAFVNTNNSQRETANKIVQEIVDSIYGLDKNIAPQILHLARIELTSDNSKIVVKDYSLEILKKLEQFLSVFTNVISPDKIIALKRYLICLNQLFRGCTGLSTEVFWKRLKLGDSNPLEQRAIREQLGLSAYNFFLQIISKAPSCDILPISTENMKIKTN